MRDNPNLKGDVLDDGPENQPWDDSVESLLTFPNVSKYNNFTNNVNVNNAKGKLTQTIMSRAAQSWKHGRSRAGGPRRHPSCGNPAERNARRLRPLPSRPVRRFRRHDRRWSITTAWSHQKDLGRRPASSPRVDQGSTPTTPGRGCESRTRRLAAGSRYSEPSRLLDQAAPTTARGAGRCAASRRPPMHRAWNAAQRAAQDADLRVTSVDRATGTIQGDRAAIAATILAPPGRRQDAGGAEAAGPAPDRSHPLRSLLQCVQRTLHGPLGPGGRRSRRASLIVHARNGRPPARERPGSRSSRSRPPTYGLAAREVAALMRPNNVTPRRPKSPRARRAGRTGGAAGGPDHAYGLVDRAGRPAPPPRRGGRRTGRRGGGRSGRSGLGVCTWSRRRPSSAAQACAGCHADQFARWKGSQHAAAMQPATVETVRGDFQRRPLRGQRHGGHLWPARRKYVIRTEGPDGKPADFEVKYTFGVAPLQQYLRRAAARPPAGAHGGLGYAPRGTRRPALVPPPAR